MGKQVLITGAATGFGRAVVIELAKLGWDVIAGCENWPQVSSLRADPELGGLRERVTVIKLDVTDEIDRSNAVLKYSPDVFFYNAGIMESGAVIEAPISIFRKVFEVNVFAGILLLQGFGRKMVERKSGRIVWTSSQAGLSAMAYDAPYCASKFAVEAIASAARDELAPFGVQVVTVTPGGFKTGFNETGLEAQHQWRDQLEFKLPAEPNTSWLSRQADPAIMVKGMVAAITDEHPRYRTFLPQEMEEWTKERQAEQWTKRL